MAKNDMPFRPSRSATKAENTTAMARSLIDDESATRDKKTRRLRAARLERDATQQEASQATMSPKTHTKKRAKP